jgi:DNA-binding MarR family transcriptional regulator
MQKPIGYWLKTLDRLIDENFDRALAAEGAQRRHWQILNIVKTSPATNATIAAALDPFWTEGAITLDEVLADMTRRGWITGHEPRQLTAAGAAALDAIRERANLCEKIMAGLTAEQYTQTVAVLEQMAANLTPA